MDWKPEKPPSAKEIAGRFRDDIAAGTYPPGRQLPGAKGVAKALGVALMTVQSAYKQLAEDGLVEGRPGSGTYVIEPQKGQPSASETALGLRELQDHLSHVTSQLSELRDRVARLETVQPGRSDENQ
ncbi:GntR family transcriptional regulator [Actinacidiphila acidipaludis]|uniref:Winged helix-turn-helix domain-containing protein n=1 Tax=Actinacidiphila acidipaludis TaxID=2873382 RepID=A0ABS7Q2W7_9ACTN|nr:winged helix-turn-helix domain-containing protein [Streptomyces acidipaludis]MBY8877479.1 winged helix-turn-helix domain-containing protein [Streptomyces acidipaludis]